MTSGWPKSWRVREEFLKNTERYLQIGEDICKIVSYRTAQSVEWKSAPSIPQTLAGVLPLCERTMLPLCRDLQEEITEEEAAELWNQVCERATELAARGRLPSTWVHTDALSAWETFCLIAITVAEGMSYAISHRTPPWDEVEEGGFKRFSQWFEGVTIYAVSIQQAVFYDFRALPWLARQPLKHGFRGLCRHYSRIVQTLFYAAKRATGRYSNAHVLTISGMPSFTNPFGHAWNWFLEGYRPHIVAVDLTGADWLLDRRCATSIFNRGFDGARWNNVSAFVYNLFRDFSWGASSPLHDRDEVCSLLANLINPHTIHGQAILYHVALQPIHNVVRERIKDFLAKKGFDRLFPEWRSVLRAVNFRARKIGNFGDPQKHLLLIDAIGI